MTHTRVILLSLGAAATMVGGLFLLLILQGKPSLVTVLPLVKEIVAEAEPSRPVSLVFVGDVMLARDVESRLLAQPEGYALSALKDRLKGDMVVANFEASIPEVHQPTVTMEMRFSVLPKLAAELQKGGFTHVSLANNHALDSGTDGYRHTVATLESLGLESAGHPGQVSASSVFTQVFNERKVVVANINATYNYPSLESIKSSLPPGLKDEDLLVAYIHWGDEYELLHGERQEAFARLLVDEGFDLIAGHHPHVVQDIEQYRDGLIFYSLGNFIFDQYWRPEVQQGLLLDLTETADGWKVDVVLVESRTVRAQPREMIGEEREIFLEGLAERSSLSLKADIAKGELLLQF